MFAQASTDTSGIQWAVIAAVVAVTYTLLRAGYKWFESHVDERREARETIVRTTKLTKRMKKLQKSLDDAERYNVRKMREAREHADLDNQRALMTMAWARQNFPDKTPLDLPVIIEDRSVEAMRRLFPS